jgi:spermidine synthase
VTANRALFLFAYTCSGLAGLVYEVSWTRLLTLYLGHTTAAASAVVAAFLGGLAFGAAGGGRVATRTSPRQALFVYLGLETLVIVAALALPLELRAATPLLKWSYGDAAAGWLFPTVRLLLCLILIFVPASALGATFPMAVRWFAHDSRNAAQSSGALYAMNTAGAAIGALLAGFVLIPVIGLSGTTYVAIAATAVALAAVAVVAAREGSRSASVPLEPPEPVRPRGRQRKGKRSTSDVSPSAVPSHEWTVAAILGLSGFAALMHEIAWTRILSLILGPTVYAFAATLAVVILGVAIGSGLGTAIVGRTRDAAGWLTATMIGAALTAAWTYSLAGNRIPRLLAQQFAASPDLFERFLNPGTTLAAALILPTALCLGAAFPLALSLLGKAEDSAARRFGLVYAVNTLGAVSGSLAAGFLFIPRFGLQPTLWIVSGCLLAAALLTVAQGRLTKSARAAAALASVAAVALSAAGPPWDRELMASGAYLYARYVPKDLDLETLLKAGTLLYYREGAAATVSVKRLTGTTTLAVDGKVDASNRGDMLTQNLVAHLPLLIHENPRDVAVIGLGSGVTLGAALKHPIARADVIEISPEVVEASRFFADENHRALEDHRTNLIVGDGRSHLQLTNRRYDVVISEPSNPWIAGVAALFTREFFVAARERLAPGGIICQWAHTYTISDPALRSVVATFTSVFPDATAWLVGGDDLLLIASAPDPDRPDRPALGSRLDNIGRSWSRPGVAEDLREVGAVEPFTLLSLYAAGPSELSRYSNGAPLLTDDRMTLEFSGPRDLHEAGAGNNRATLAALFDRQAAPAAVRHSWSAVGATQWRNRAAMLAQSDVHALAYEDYKQALLLDPRDVAAFDGLVKSAVLAARTAEALAWTNGLTPHVPEALVAASKLHMANGSHAAAVDAANRASQATPVYPRAFEQLASLAADTGDVVELDIALAKLKELAPETAATHYYAAASAFMHGRFAESFREAERAIAIDPEYAATYDLIGAAYTKLGQPEKARDAFLTSLRFDAHDSTAYTNLGLLELTAGNHRVAANYFAEALGLDPHSPAARQGLTKAQIGVSN